MTNEMMLALAGFGPLAFALFFLLPVRRAALASFVLGWLFLPQVRVEVPGVLPDVDRYVVLSVSTLVAMGVLAPAHFARVRPRLADLPAIVWCLCPIVTSLSNALGLYDGLSGALDRTLHWGLPYLIARVALGDAQGLRLLTMALFVGGLLYVPFCLYEVRMSPQLHKIFYGWHQHSFAQTYRLGGFRPTVFLQHGLAVGMWMSAATLAGVWLWRTGAARIHGVIMPWLVSVLFVTTVLCKSLGSLLLLAAGLGALWLTRRLGSALPILALTFIPPVYVVARVSDAWTGEDLVALIDEYAGPERAQSVQFRLDNEVLLRDRALERPLLGWGGWGRNRVKDERGRDRTTIDGYWISVLGENGVLGLLAFGGMLLVPVWLVGLTGGAAPWRDPRAAPAGLLATFLALYTIDGLLNAMLNPFVALTAGALSGLYAESARARPARPPRPAALEAPPALAGAAPR